MSTDTVVLGAIFAVLVALSILKPGLHPPTVAKRFAPVAMVLLIVLSIVFLCFIKTLPAAVLLAWPFLFVTALWTINPRHVNMHARKGCNWPD